MNELKEEIKKYAKKLGADIVGIAPVSRWKKAPVEHSPKGIFPKAKSVIVCAVHIPDACVELGAEKDVREPGPGLVQINVGNNLNRIGYWMAKFLEELGWNALTVPSTGYWVYRKQPGAERGWMADMCHYYAAAAAGLGEIGWHNICITPEFGPRQRFISILTDAPLRPDPLYSGEPLCDKCLLCAKHCPTKSFEKEVSGNCVIEIENKKFVFPKRNLWRCAIGENFQLDVLKEWPEKINEETILKMEEIACTKHPEWIRGWKMGICLKWCVNPQRRYFDRNYSSSPRRKRDILPDTSPEMVNRIIEEVIFLAYEKGTDFLATIDANFLKENNLEIKKELPDGEGAILLGIDYPERCEVLNPFVKAYYIELLVANFIEKYGYSVLLWSNINPEDVAELFDIKKKNRIYRLILTQLPLKTSIQKKEEKSNYSRKLSPEELTAKIKKQTFNTGADLVGITSISRVEKLILQLNEVLDKEKNYFTVKNLPPVEVKKRNVWAFQAMPFNPQVEKKELKMKKPSEYLKEVKSAIVIGIKIPDASVDWAGKGKGKKAGHYEFMAHWGAKMVLSSILLETAKFLDYFGYKVFPLLDETDSHSLTANRIYAISAGLGEIGWNGMVLTPQFGARQCFGVILTDAILIEDKLYEGKSLCKRCYKCVELCPADAISKNENISISIEGKTFTWGKINRLRCDWACKYGLLGDAGPKYFHSKNNFSIPENITPEILCEAIKKSDRLQRPGYTGIVEKCFIECPAGKE